MKTLNKTVFGLYWLLSCYDKRCICLVLVMALNDRIQSAKGSVEALYY